MAIGQTAMHNVDAEFNVPAILIYINFIIRNLLADDVGITEIFSRQYHD